MPDRARQYRPRTWLAGSALAEVMSVPAWKSLPSWHLVAQGDQAIPPDAERLFAQRMGATTIEVATNHVAMVSHPDDVVQLVKTAAETLSTTEAARNDSSTPARASVSESSPRLGLGQERPRAEDAGTPRRS